MNISLLVLALLKRYCRSSANRNIVLQEDGASNLAPDLLSQIDETLEEITPCCVLELLALPIDEKHKSKRQEGLQGARNILWSVGRGGIATVGGGFSREAFMNEAFLRMTSAEQVCVYQV